MVLGTKLKEYLEEQAKKLQDLHKKVYDIEKKVAKALAPIVVLDSAFLGGGLRVETDIKDSIGKLVDSVKSTLKEHVDNANYLDSISQILF